MIELKFSPAQDNWLEVTWTDVVQLPDTIHPARPAVYELIPDEYGELHPGAIVEAATPEEVVPGEVVRTELKHTSYHPTQLAMLQADATTMGTPLDDHAQMLADWVSSYAHQAPEPLTVADFEAALDAHLDATAQTKRYDNRITCALRAGYVGPFQAEGLAFATWMDRCNAIAYQFLAEVQAGSRVLPNDKRELIDALPPMVWN